MSASLCQKYGITEENLATRRAFVRIGSEERQLMQELSSWAEETAPQIAREFYDWQFSFGPTRSFFEDMARKKGTSLSQLRTHSR